jgi:hypothetical protein
MSHSLSTLRLFSPDRRQRAEPDNAVARAEKNSRYTLNFVLGLLAVSLSAACAPPGGQRQMTQVNANEIILEGGLCLEAAALPSPWRAGAGDTQSMVFHALPAELGLPELPFGYRPTEIEAGIRVGPSVVPYYLVASFERLRSNFEAGLLRDKSEVYDSAGLPWKYERYELGYPILVDWRNRAQCRFSEFADPAWGIGGRCEVLDSANRFLVTFSINWDHVQLLPEISEKVLAASRALLTSCAGQLS